ncbi:hypothetical protein DVH24_014941 [Malus domestica]|uniref:RNase H type-1 domain-containing protein n=1 Tax=Malus domestica TaxID=3750 RepID=A0A498K888_MALDO|nr:hypothetical protein DVH24_014941 [Malus domestica]
MELTKLMGGGTEGRLIARFGAIIRDSNGCFVVARTGSFEDISSPLLSKAMAVRAGLLWAIDRGYQSLIISVEGSYSQFVNHWASCGGLQSFAQHNQ